MRLSNIEQDLLTELHREDSEGLMKFIHDYLGSPAAAYAVTIASDWGRLYNYIYLHLHLISDSDIIEYLGD